LTDFAFTTALRVGPRRAPARRVPSRPQARHRSMSLHCPTYRSRTEMRWKCRPEPVAVAVELHGGAPLTVLHRPGRLRSAKGRKSRPFAASYHFGADDLVSRVAREDLYRHTVGLPSHHM